MNRINRFRDEDDPVEEFKLQSAAMSEEDAICFFENILKQHRDIQIVRMCAAQASLIAAEFFSDDQIELDFSLFFGDEYLCHIYKRWTDPGFRVNQDLSLDKERSDFKNKFLKIVTICAANFIGFEPSEENDGQMSLILEICIFADGFNEKVLRRAVESLEEAVKKITLVLEE